MQRRHLALVLFELMRARTLHAPIGDSGGGDEHIGRQRGFNSGQHFTRRIDMLHLRAIRVGQRHRPRYKHHLGTGLDRRCGQRMALLAGGAVGNIAHRVNRLMRGAGGDNHPFARQRLVGQR